MSNEEERRGVYIPPPGDLISKCTGAYITMD
jgi:hypothetical protein